MLTSRRQERLHIISRIPRGTVHGKAFGHCKYFPPQKPHIFPWHFFSIVAPVIQLGPDQSDLGRYFRRSKHQLAFGATAHPPPWLEPDPLPGLHLSQFTAIPMQTLPDHCQPPLFFPSCVPREADAIWEQNCHCCFFTTAGTFPLD